MTNLIAPVLESGSLTQWRNQQHEALIPLIFKEIGPDAVIFPLFNSQMDLGAASFTARVKDTTNAVATSMAYELSAAPSSISALTNPIGFTGIVPFIEIEAADTNWGIEGDDNAFYSRDDAGGANGFSVGALINPAGDGTNRAIMSKYNNAPNREWIFRITSGDRISLSLWDESVEAATSDGDEIVFSTTDGIVVGTWYTVAVTYDGAGGAPGASNGLKAYINGVEDTNATSSGGGYVGMEDLASQIRLCRFAGTSQLYTGKIGGLSAGPFYTHRTMSSAQVFNWHGLVASAAGMAI